MDRDHDYRCECHCTTPQAEEASAAEAAEDKAHEGAHDDEG